MVIKQIIFSSYINGDDIFFEDDVYDFLTKHNVKVMCNLYTLTIKNNEHLVFYFKNVLDFVFPSDRDYAKFKLRFMK